MVQVGTKVICINDKFHPSIAEYGDDLPIKGNVYTVARVTEAVYPLTGELGAAYWLAELSNPMKTEGTGQLTFSAWRFAELADEANECPQELSLQITDDEVCRPRRAIKETISR